jgi:predicted nucleic acid-binding protein
MTVLIDTNILVRLVDPKTAAERQSAIDRLEGLRRAGQRLCITPQSIAEFWAVATRPLPANGLGLSVAEAQAATAGIEERFELLCCDEAVLHPVWRRLVVEHAAAGRAAFDVRLVAVMQVHSVAAILTFDAGFARYGVTVFAPTAP